MTKDSLDLTALDEEEFRNLVNADVRSHQHSLDEEMVAALRNPRVADRWFYTLASLKRNVEAQMTAKRFERSEWFLKFQDGDIDENEWLRARVEILRWKQGAVRFRNGLEDRLSEAKAIREERDAQLPVKQLQQERDSSIQKLLMLKAAIVRHRAEVLEDPDNSEPADEELWSQVENT